MQSNTRLSEQTWNKSEPSLRGLVEGSSLGLWVKASTKDLKG